MRRFLDPSTHKLYGRLIILQTSEGKSNEAEMLYGKILADGQSLLGSGHPVTLQTLNNLKFTYQSQERYKEAETLYNRALDNNIYIVHELRTI